MATKVKCQKCGAKNPLDAPRCRICTAVINVHAAADPPAPPAPSSPPTGLEDHFDADVINRQIQPARSHFGGTGSSGGLSARIAAANGGEMPQSVFGTRQTPMGRGPRESSSGDERSEASAPYGPLLGEPTETPAPSRANDEFEPFDADALFRDMHSPS